MYIIIDETRYEKIANLTFAPEIDVTGGSVPAGEFQADIVTADEIAYGQFAKLYDGLDQLWAEYWVIYAERVEKGRVRVRAQSRVMLMERMELGVAKYDNDAASDVLDDIFTTLGSGTYFSLGGYRLDESLRSARITGYLPAQSARERLSWVCYVLGAYVKDFFCSQLEILPIGADAVLIPINRTFMKPSVTYRDYVTAVRARAYTLSEGTPQSGDTSVEGPDGRKYIVTSIQVTLGNPYAPRNAPPNVVDLAEMYLVNENNVSALLTRMGLYHFYRMQVQLDCVDNGEYLPGQRATVYLDEERMASGYVQRCDFSFGTQARATVRLEAAEDVDTAPLTILYRYAGETLASVNLRFPVGYSYEVFTQWLDVTRDGVRTVYAPHGVKFEGVMPAEGVEETVECEIALRQEDGELAVLFVDDIEDDGEGVLSIK